MLGDRNWNPTFSRTNTRLFADYRFENASLAPSPTKVAVKERRIQVSTRGMS